MIADITFTDTETTGLDPNKHCLWEVGVVHRLAIDGGKELTHLYQVRPDLTNASPKALEIGKYAERFKVPDGVDAVRLDPETGDVAVVVTLDTVRRAVHRALYRSVMMGSNPGFDAGFIKKFLNGNTPWHYRPVDIVTLAAGKLGLTTQQTIAWRSEDVSKALGIDPSNYPRHTALGDAYWVRDMFDALNDLD